MYLTGPDCKISDFASYGPFNVYMHTKAEVIGIFRTTKTNSAGYDNLSRNIIKDIFSKLAEPITHITNLSLQTGEVPDEIKTSIIKPTYKSGKKTV